MGRYYLRVSPHVLSPDVKNTKKNYKAIVSGRGFSGSEVSLKYQCWVDIIKLSHKIHVFPLLNITYSFVSCSLKTNLFAEIYVCHLLCFFYISFSTTCFQSRLAFSLVCCEQAALCEICEDFMFWKESWRIFAGR